MNYDRTYTGLEPFTFTSNQGWQCPCCKKVYSPTTPMCFYCGNQTYKTSTSTTFNEEND